MASTTNPVDASWIMFARGCINGVLSMLSISALPKLARRGSKINPISYRRKQERTEESPKVGDEGMKG